MLVGFFYINSNNTQKKLYNFIFFDLISPCKTIKFIGLTKNKYKMKKTIILLSLLFTICISMNAQRRPNRTPLPECQFEVKAEKAYFYNIVNEGGRTSYVKRKGYLVQYDTVWTICKYSDKEYVYVEFRNQRGQVTKGFIKRYLLEGLD